MKMRLTPYGPSTNKWDTYKNFNYGWILRSQLERTVQSDGPPVLGCGVRVFAAEVLEAAFH